MLRRGLRGPRGAWVGLAVQKAWKNLTIRELAAIAGASLRMSASSANLLAEKETAELLGLLPILSESESEITSHRFPFNMPAQNRSAFNWRVQMG
jgi:hypothetical protein